ncbi:Uu.00g050420.m01.CDS01 [Anthostomella pinea]|uniref:Uu.00g050420.m01.CDS01 n=1 Tax=Anthostomella pinea TaxID=933095 RepID=A0AAI8YMN8_9PEZI|nr:Uu.00g050420.m01.CDS01 [Anthostomella pinea]
MSMTMATKSEAAMTTADPYVGLTITAFEGGITTRIITHPKHPSRVFAYEVTFLLQHPRVVQVATQKPPLHFHPYQEEYLQIVEGRLAVEVEGVESVLGPDDGEFCLRPWSNHRLYAPTVAEKEGDVDSGTGTGTGSEKTVFLLSGQYTDAAFRLDTVFFENWYAYQDQIVVQGEKVDLVQVLSMFDAGGSYLSLPWWVPLGRTISRALGIVVGRWIGGLLGYQPFYRKWTTDWESACRKMEMSIFQRRFADRAKTA